MRGGGWCEEGRRGRRMDEDGVRTGEGGMWRRMVGGGEVSGGGWCEWRGWCVWRRVR